MILGEQETLDLISVVTQSELPNEAKIKIVQTLSSARSIRKASDVASLCLLAIIYHWHKEAGHPMGEAPSVTVPLSAIKEIDQNIKEFGMPKLVYREEGEEAVVSMHWDKTNGSTTEPDQRAG
jgi:hypothetical protein